MSPSLSLTPSLPLPVKFLGRKVHTYTPANSIFDSPITNLLSVLRILIETLSRVHAKGGKGLNDFRSGAFTGRFQSDSAESTAVKGLSLVTHFLLWCLYLFKPGLVMPLCSLEALL